MALLTVYKGYTILPICDASYQKSKLYPIQDLCQEQIVRKAVTKSVRRA